jgi:hypothetical protein
LERTDAIIALVAFANRSRHHFAAGDGEAGVARERGTS